MAKLTLSNKKEITVNTGSSTSAVFITGTAEEAAAAVAAISNDTLDGAVIEDNSGTYTIVDKVFTGFAGTPESDGNINITFSLRDKTEVEKINDQITELQTAMAELAESEA